MIVTSLNWLLSSPDDIRQTVVSRAMQTIPEEDFNLWSGSRHNTQFSNSSDRYEMDFRVIQEREPRLLRDTLLGLVSDYNSQREDFMKTHPVSALLIWNFYKKTQVALRSTSVFADQFQTLPDRDFALFYLNHQAIIAGSKDSKLFKAGGNITLVGYDPNFMFGVGQYKFRDENGKEVESIWDFRKKELPAFVYAKKL